jgi:hypothetical protein
LRDRLKRDHVAGRSARFGREEMLATMRRVTTGSPRALLGAAPLGDLSAAQVQDAVSAVYGWEGDGPRARISASCTIDGFDAACSRVLEVARDRRRIAFATARPASLLPLYRDLAAAAAAAGADVATATESGVFGTRGRRLRWLDRVAVATDGVTLLGDDDPEAAEELLFTVARPDLVVADRCFAGVALRAGFGGAFADLDAAVPGRGPPRSRGRVIPSTSAALRRPTSHSASGSPSSFRGASGARPPIPASLPASRAPTPVSTLPSSCSFATRAARAYARPAEERGKRKG